MKKLTILIAMLMAVNIAILANNLEGYCYGTKSAPDGNEWQSPQALALNKEQPRAYLIPFKDINEAKGVLPAVSSFYQTLDGTWKFHWVAKPEDRPKDFYQPSYNTNQWDDIEVPGCWNVQGLQKDGSMKYGVPIYVNQPVIFYHEVREGDWRQGVMRQPKDERWTTYKYPNEVGSYRRSFTLPANWKGKQVYINFDGVDSFFYLWINGHYVGFSKNSRNTARFNITSYLVKGENVVAVEVYRNSDGSFLEAQDMFRLPGIIRSTYLTAMPQVQLRDMAVRTTKIDGCDATISVDAEICNLSKKKDAYTIDYYIYETALYQDEPTRLVGKYANKPASTNISLFNIQTWSAEIPNRYILVACLKGKNGRMLDCTSTFFGIRTVEIKDTPASEDEFGLAGRYFYVNNKPVKLKGVNRHETNPERGHAITHEQMEEEVKLMKQGNINHVRLSHYSNDPYFYYLADKYGLYLEDECNLESHEYYYGEASLSHPEEWKAAHVARNMEMVHGHINHPSIVIWSLGNEAGPGNNFVAAYNAIRSYDTSRPVQYERNNDIVDMGSNQYPSVGWVQQAVKGQYNIKYPFHISEYAHSMGNSLGNLVDYWDAIERTNFFCGGAIWDWVDQAIVTYTSDGVKYMGYGGDHGDWPNDGMFCMNGIMLPDLSPKPQYFEVKKVYQNVGVTLDTIITTGKTPQAKLTIFNKNYFESINKDNYYLYGLLYRDGRPISTRALTLTTPIAPRESRSFTYPLEKNDLKGELFLNIEFRHIKEKPWARAGFVQMSEQLSLGNYSKPAQLQGNGQTLKVVCSGGETEVQGHGWNICFDDSNGFIHKIYVDNQCLIGAGNGPKLDALRAPVDNDNWIRNQWFQAGLHNLRHHTTAPAIITNNADGSVSISYTTVSQGEYAGQLKHRPGKAGEPYESIEKGKQLTENDFHFTTSICYTVYNDGTVDMQSSIVSSDPNLSLPRLGYALEMSKQYNKYTYYGRGPLNNYADRKTGSFIGRYESSVDEQFVNFPKPQSMGNREDVRWCALTDNSGNGLLFVSDSHMSTSALPWSALQMTLTQHPHELPVNDVNYLHLDCQVLGLGGNSCGQGGPLESDCVKGALHQMKLIIRPVKAGASLQQMASVQSNKRCPLTIVRDRSGKVTICGDSLKPHPICYNIDGGATKSYVIGSPINMRNGGTIKAWYEGEEKIVAKEGYSRIENIPLEVVYVSSEEGPGGDLATNLIDGDPSTIWHTMYSITVPKYPHWIDFDCGEQKTIKGFTYLPRQDGGLNGNIRDYKIEVSNDGKSWKPASNGSFEKNSKEQRILFPTAVKARYLRFTALSSQNGADYASGAEFSVLAE